MRKDKVNWKKAIIAVISLNLVMGMAGVAFVTANQQNNVEIIASAEESTAGKYTVNIQLMQFHSDELSMGNESMIPQAQIVVNTDGTASIEIDMQSLTYLGRNGYLGWLKKVTNIISENRFHYPTEFETEDALVLEEYENVYDEFNSSESEYVDAEVNGKWYPKKLSIPINFDNRDDDILVQVYVPVMESIMEGGGTKFATLDIDWDSLVKTEDFTETVTTEPSTENENQTTTTDILETTTQATTSEITTVPTETTTTSVSSEYDKDDLADGKYELYAEMIKTDRESYSMSNNGINHTVQLEVINGEYYLTVQFKGLAIYNQFGYLMDLYYFNQGYTYNDFGAPQGDVTPAEVLSTYDVVDQYNDAEHLYPQLLKFPLVDKASGEYVPLQVFVPIMEAIADGTGTQSVLMQLDWSTLKKVNDGNDFELEESDEQSPEFDFTDSVTGVKIHADKGVFAENTTANVSQITSGEVYDTAKNLISDISSEFNLYDIAFSGEDGTEAKPNGKIQIEIPIPSDFLTPVVYRISDGRKTLINGTVSDGMFTFSAKEAGTYLIADKSASSSKTNQTNNKNSNTNTNTTKTKTTTTSPKTGDSGIGAILSALAVSVGAVILSKKRKEK
jgi:LPXTG-motif cell wall-anchored protein